MAELVIARPHAAAQRNEVAHALAEADFPEILVAALDVVVVQQQEALLAGELPLGAAELRQQIPAVAQLELETERDVVLAVSPSSSSPTGVKTPNATPRPPVSISARLSLTWRN